MEKKEKKEKKKKNICLNICIGLLLALFICIIVFVSIYSEDYRLHVERNNKAEESQKVESTTINSLDFDTNNVNNGSTNSYTLADYSGTIDITIDETGKNATLSYNRANLSNTYTLNWDLTGVEEGVLEKQTITFNNKVNDVLVGSIGQDSTGDVILFLMEDGTIAYIPVYQTLSTNGVEGLTTYQTISNIKDVVKFYSANATSGASSSVTILAQTKDGTLYDLGPIINNTSNNQ